MRCLTIAMILAAPAIADTPLTVDDFEAFVSGRTLSYAADGVKYGVEEYLSDRRVRWSHLDGDCDEGHWFESEGDVCFVYDGIETPQCWRYYLREDQLVAEYANNPLVSEIYELDAVTGPLQCVGPGFDV